ncbi:MAG: PrsW family intramembrane metalloprotease [Acidobacteria bacterium]|nr:PrsW family intramembrane metalloprotease [Acidobacteriota bacterium]
MKLSLTIETGTFAGRTFELSEGTITLGRGEKCSIRFDPLIERVMSKEHCAIEARADGFYITDRNSTNGTYLNGERIGTSRLSGGDVLQFGKNGVKGTIAIEADENASAATVFAAAPYIPRPAEQATVAYPASSPAFETVPASPGPSQATVVAGGVRNSISNFSLGSMPQEYQPEPEKSNPLMIIGIVAAIIGSLICLLLVVLITVLSVGPLTAIVATFVAFAPVIFYLIPYLLIDRYDPEPLWLLALAFAWGGLVSIAFSFFANTIAGIGAAVAVNPEFGDGFMAVAAAPIFEEGSKGLGVLLLLVVFRKYFDDILDGIVFAGVVGLGFATVENILYYGRALNGGGLIALAILFGLRGLLSPFAHATFTAMTGIGCGISRESHSKPVKILFPLVGYVLAVCLHSLWNGLAVFASRILETLSIGWLCDWLQQSGLESLCAFLIAYAALQIPLFVIFIAFTVYVLVRQNRILKEMLAIDVARGLFPEEHAKTATSIFGSIFWRLGGIGSGKFGARTKYLRTLGKLGLSYWHIQRATEAHGQTASFQQNPILRNEVLRWREKV